MGILLNSLSVAYPGGREILHNLTAEIPAGISVAIVGESGIGKTTLLQVLAGNIVPKQGEITLNGRKLSALRKSKISMIYQDHNLINGLNALDNVAVKGIISGMGKKQAYAEAEALLKSFKIPVKQPVEKLSGGQASRVDFCRAMINTPELILADEPTASLDQKNSSQLMELLLSQKATKIITTHDPRVFNACELILELEQTRSKTLLTPVKAV